MTRRIAAVSKFKAMLPKLRLALPDSAEWVFAFIVTGVCDATVPGDPGY